MDPVVFPPSPTRDGVDRISYLADDVILHILSFLPTKYAVRTSTLSRRWEYLWTSVSVIDFGDDPVLYDSLGFLECVDRVLRLHDASDIKRLRLIVLRPVTFSLLHSWISTAMTHNIQHLELYLSHLRDSLPCSLFTCQSLRSLALEVYVALPTPTVVHLPHLKTLRLCSVEFVDDKSTEILFSGCPVLEELFLWCCYWDNIENVNITIPTLKKLNIRHDVVHGERLSGVINIYAPNLISLDYFTFLRVDFYLHNICSLVDASICGSSSLGDHEIARRLFNLVASAYNVKSLAVDNGGLDVLDEVEELVDRLPTFHNLTNFTVASAFHEWASSCRALMALFEKSPNLECINFTEGLYWVDEKVEDENIFESVPSCIENSLEKVVISSFAGRRGEFYILRYFLRNAKKLETITLYFHDSSAEWKEELKEMLERLLEGGPGKCLIELL